MYKRLAFLFLLTSGIQLSGCTASDQGGDQSTVAKNVNATEFEKMMHENQGQVLDVRTAGEVAQGHISGSVNYDFYNSDFQKNLENLDKDKPVYVYCAAGGRSSKAMNQMKSMGFKEVYNLEGGFGAWVAKGLPVEK